MSVQRKPFLDLYFSRTESIRLLEAEGYVSYPESRVLRALVAYADADGLISMGMEELAWHARMSVTGARKAVRGLVEGRYLFRRPGGGRARPSDYQVNVAWFGGGPVEVLV